MSSPHREKSEMKIFHNSQSNHVVISGHLCNSFLDNNIFCNNLTKYAYEYSIN